MQVILLTKLMRVNHFSRNHIDTFRKHWGHGCRKGGAWPPLGFEIISKKRLFFQFRGVKTKFHHFCSHWKKFWGNPLLAPSLEKILPTPMIGISVPAKKILH